MKKFFLLLLTVFALVVHISAEDSKVMPKSHKNLNDILIINSYSDGASWSQVLMSKIMVKMLEAPNVSCEFANLSTPFVRNDSLYNAMVEHFFDRYEYFTPNIIVILGNMGFSFREQLRAQWDDVPIVLIGESDFIAAPEWYYSGRPVEMGDENTIRLADLRRDYNFTFIEAPYNYAETVDMMVNMVPELRKIVFASNDLYINQRLDHLIQAYISQNHPHLEYQRITGGSDADEEFKSLLINQKDKSVGVIYGSWFFERQDMNGNKTIMAGSTNLLSFSACPIFSMRYDFSQDSGFDGMVSYDPEAMKDLVCEYLQRIIRGEEARKIPFLLKSKPIHYVNYPQAIRDQLDIDLAPADTVFIGRPDSLWKQYKWQTITTLSVLLVIIIGVIIILMEQRRRNKLLRYHSALIQNMPLFYAHAIPEWDENERVKNIVLSEGNIATSKLSETLGLSGEFDRNVEQLRRLVETALKEQREVRYTSYFRETNAYYDFIITPSVDKRSVNMFGVNATARHDAERQLRESNKKLELTLGVAHIIPWRWDLVKQTITCEEQRVFNRLRDHLARKRGAKEEASRVYDAEDYMHRIHPEDLEIVQTLLKKLLIGEESRGSIEFRVVTEICGRRLVDWVEVNAIAERCEENGSICALSGSMLLITQRKKQEQVLIAAREKARESDLLKSAFLANMSHEIRTPLNAIVGFSSLLVNSQDDQEKEEYKGIIENNNSLLLQLIGDILDLSKIESGTLEFSEQTIDLNNLFLQIEASNKPRVKEGVRLIRAFGGENTLIVGDPNRITQVLNNMMSNAAKFTMSGSITFGYEVREKTGMLRFFVKDTGVGIDKADQKRIFDRYMQVNTFVQGSGLGLAICKSIVEDVMHGSIGVDSDGVGKGSTFWFDIPMRRPSHIAGKVEEKHIEKQPIATRLKVLIAEDNESNYHLLYSILKKDYDLIHAWDGEEAVRLFKEHTPHIILMDLNMPKMDGYEATNEIRKLSSTVPIVAVTAYAYELDRDRVLNSGFNDYVSKPVNFRDLRAAMNRLITRNFF